MHLQGGDILQETITSNITEDVITLEFQRSDGTLVTQLVDLKNVSLCQENSNYLIIILCRLHISRIIYKDIKYF